MCVNLFVMLSDISSAEKTVHSWGRGDCGMLYYTFYESSCINSSLPLSLSPSLSFPPSLPPSLPWSLSSLSPLPPYLPLSPSLPLSLPPSLSLLPFLPQVSLVLGLLTPIALLNLSLYQTVFYQSMYSVAVTVVWSSPI